MQNWEKALNKFLKPWKKRKDVIGAVVCGSYVTGKPTKHSDIDVHIVLKDGTKWRERGNKIVDGFIIEYFANPSKQITKYFQDDYKNNSQMAVIQFLTGKILFDDGTILKLKKEAKKYYDKKFEKIPNAVRELNKYALWDAFDNLQDAFEEKKTFFLVYLS